MVVYLRIFMEYTEVPIPGRIATLAQSFFFGMGFVLMQRD